MENGKTYYRSSETPLFDWKDTSQNFIVTTYLEKDGTPKKDKNGNDEQSFFLKDDLAVVKSKSSKKKANVNVEEKSIKIVDVKEEKQDKIWYSLTLENGWVYRRESKTDLCDWKDKVREFHTQLHSLDTFSIHLFQHRKRSSNDTLANQS